MRNIAQKQQNDTLQEKRISKCLLVFVKMRNFAIEK